MNLMDSEMRVADQNRTGKLLLGSIGKLLITIGSIGIVTMGGYHLK